MALIRIPEKSVEIADLEIRLGVLENKIELMISRSEENKKLVVSAIVTLSTGVLSYIVSILVRTYL